MESYETYREMQDKAYSGVSLTLNSAKKKKKKGAKRKTNTAITNAIPPSQITNGNWGGQNGGIGSGPVWSTKGTATGTVPVGTTFANHTSTVGVAVPTYKAVGYRTVEDCLAFRDSVEAAQDPYTEKELEELCGETGEHTEFGRPFNGIVIDSFKPKLFTENGEEVPTPHLPNMYKVLIDEKTILWFNESEIAPMRPADCWPKEEKKVPGNV